MSVDPETPHNQYGKVDYKIRVVGRIPRHTGSLSNTDPNYDYPTRKFKMNGTTLCALDAIMSHVAAMYGVGRLLHSICDPFNASIIRAEMETLRTRNEAEVSQDDIDKWKKEIGNKEKLDPLVKEHSHNSSEARNLTPRCPYLFQLAYKSMYAGNQPSYWCGARELDLRHRGLDGPRVLKGRSGADSFSFSETESWYVYIDVSEPLSPRYAFMQRTDIVGCAYSRDTFRVGNQLRIFNAQHHATRYLIPESEYFSECEKFGEKPMERHLKGTSITSTRSSIDLRSPEEEAALWNDPEYRALMESRMARARAHPAVIRMKNFGWLREEDVIQPGGQALLQHVWAYSMGDPDHDRTSSLHIIVNAPRRIDIARSETIDGREPRALPYWQYRLPQISESAALPQTLKTAAATTILGSRRANNEDDILSQLAALEGTMGFKFLKIMLTKTLWDESAKGGSGVRDKVHSWTKGNTGFRAAIEVEPWRAEDYGLAYSDIREQEDRFQHFGAIVVYQALCYRAAVARERLHTETQLDEHESPLGLEEHLPSSFSEILLSDAFSYGEYPGRALGDVAHPAFDVSHFPRIDEESIICALKIWSKQIWMPNFDGDGWEFESGQSVPLRTLNVSGCHNVTRNTIRRALEAVPTITRIIMIGCVSFEEVDLTLLSLDGTLDNVECIVTSESLRASFEDPLGKIQRRDDVYNQAFSLLPLPPDEKSKAALVSTPNVFFDSGSSKKFKFKYDDQIFDKYFADGLHTRQPSHTFPRPPALAYRPETRDIIRGPPRFSVVLASSAIPHSAITGTTLPHVPIGTGIEGLGTTGLGLTSVWRGIIDLLEFLGCNEMRNTQRWSAVMWSLLVKACFSGSGSKREEQTGLAGGGEFFGLPAYFKGGLGQANEEWIFAYQFRDVRQRLTTSWMNSMTTFMYPEESVQESWAFIRYGRDSSPLSHEVPAVVLYDVRAFREAVCPHLPILSDEAKWIERVEEILENGTWKRHHYAINAQIDQGFAEKGDPTLTKFRDVMERMSKPRFMRETPQELMLLIEWMMVSQMNEGRDVI